MNIPAIPCSGASCQFESSPFEDASPVRNCDFPGSHVSFQGGWKESCEQFRILPSPDHHLGGTWKWGNLPERVEGVMVDKVAGSFFGGFNRKVLYIYYVQSFHMIIWIWRLWKMIFVDKRLMLLSYLLFLETRTVWRWYKWCLYAMGWYPPRRSSLTSKPSRKTGQGLNGTTPIISWM